MLGFDTYDVYCALIVESVLYLDSRISSINYVAVHVKMKTNYCTHYLYR